MSFGLNLANIGGAYVCHPRITFTAGVETCSALRSPMCVSHPTQSSVGRNTSITFEHASAHEKRECSYKQELLSHFVLDHDSLWPMGWERLKTR